MLHSRHGRFVIAVSAGAALGAGYSFPTIAIVALPAYAGMLLAAFRARDSGEAYLLSLVTWVLAASIGMFWVVSHPDPVLALSGATMALLIASLMAIAPAIGYRMRANTAIAMLATIGVHLGVEWMLAFGPLAFPFARLGQALAAYGPASGLVAVGTEGAASLAALLGAVGLMVAANSPAHRRFGVALVILVAAALHLIPLNRAGSTPGEAGLLAIQPGVDAEEWAYGSPEVRLSRMAVFSARALANSTGVVAVVWPESTLRIGTDDAGGLISASSDSKNIADDAPEFVTVEAALEVARSLRIPIISGAQLIRPDGNRYNSVLLLRPDGLVERYDKMIPVPVAEQARFLGMRLHNGPDYLSGRESAIFDVSGVRIGIAICFETLFLRHVQPLERQGADIILAVTQDGWWKGDRAAKQHWRFSRSRALESGLDLVQVSVSGISGVWGHDGRQGLQLPISGEPQTGIIRISAAGTKRRALPFDPSGPAALLSFSIAAVIWMRVRKTS